MIPEEAVFDEVAPGDQQEDSSDFKQSGAVNFSDAVVTATDWTTQTILSQLSKGNIELNPDFQRRDAWKIPRKSRFIESLVVGIPIPQLVLAERKNRRNSFIVIDGKQRLLALRQFCSDESDKNYVRYALDGLEIRDDLDGVFYSQMSMDASFQQDLTNFENQPIRTVVIRNWPNDRFLYDVFLRLNTGSVPLSPQELRQALHPGSFSAYVDSFSASSEAIRTILGLKAPDFRMRDAELVIRYFAFRNFLPEYKGNLAPLLDLATERFNSAWDVDNAQIIDQTTNLTEAIDFTISVFGEYAFRKWNGKNYERALNRAVFDVMVLFFDQKLIRDLCVSETQNIIMAFKDLCETDRGFRAAVEGTTKSIEAIYNRLFLWAERLSTIIGPSAVKLPALIDGRISL